MALLIGSLWPAGHKRAREPGPHCRVASTFAKTRRSHCSHLLYRPPTPSLSQACHGLYKAGYNMPDPRDRLDGSDNVLHQHMLTTKTNAVLLLCTPLHANHICMNETQIFVCLRWSHCTPTSWCRWLTWWFRVHAGDDNSPSSIVHPSLSFLSFDTHKIK